MKYSPNTRICLKRVSRPAAGTSELAPVVIEELGVTVVIKGA